MSNFGKSDNGRRAYWVEQMDAAHEFMETIAGYRLDECLEPLVHLPSLVNNDGVEVLFGDRPVGNGRNRLFYLREGLVDSFLCIAREMNSKGWVLKVEDAYRSWDIQREAGLTEETFDVVLERVLWERRGKTPPPELMHKRISALVAGRPQVAPHMAGSALDISVFRRDDGKELDRGGPYIELSELSPMDSPFISEEARQNRQSITDLMGRYGFSPYPFEFWHYSSNDVFDRFVRGGDGPVRYGPVDMDPATGKLTSITSLQERLISLEEVHSRIRKVLARGSEKVVVNGRFMRCL